MALGELFTTPSSSFLCHCAEAFYAQAQRLQIIHLIV